MAEPARATLPVAPTLARPVVLVGMMGSGKSSIGKRVASRLGVPFVDLDHEIEARRGRTVADIFATDGEVAFRTDEAALLDEVLHRTQPGVVATGGGAVTSAENRRLLRRRATVVWLHATSAVLMHRIAFDGTRPLLAGDDPRGTLERLIAEREPLYREVADHVVDVDRVDRRVVARQVLALIDPAFAAAIPDDDLADLDGPDGPDGPDGFDGSDDELGPPTGGDA